MILVVLMLASLLRLAGLGTAPPSLYWEEVALGYDAYSLWTTGKDYHGNPLPIVAFESFGDYKPSGYFYVAAPFVGILGLNNWSIRLPSALAGIASVYLVYLVSRELFKERKIALWSALTLAILPWHIQFSRAAFEVNLATMWLLLGIVLLLKSRAKKYLLLFSVIPFVAAAYTYHSLRLTGPLLAGNLILIYSKKLVRTKWLLIGAIFAFVLMIPLLQNLSNPKVTQRFAETSLFSTSKAVLVTNQFRTEDGNTIISRLIHHRYLEWGKEITEGIMSLFSPIFLFLKGDSNLRHQTGYTGLLYFWQIIPWGITLLIMQNKEKASWLVLGSWLLWAALPVALTNVTPHALRFLPAAPAFALMVGYGLYTLLARKDIFLRSGLILVMAVSLLAYIFDYLTSYSIRSEFDWQTGYRQMVSYVESIEGKYPHIQVTRAYGRPSIYFLYYLKVDPAYIQLMEPQLPKDQGELLAFDKYQFGSINPQMHGLAVSESPLEYGTIIKEIDTVDQKPVFYIYEI